jgi:hypothetical protein
MAAAVDSSAHPGAWVRRNGRRISEGVGMASPALTGPLPLSQDSLKSTIPGQSPGSYVLGPIAPNGVLDAQFVGRSDTDVAATISQHIGRYPAFSFAYATSALAAFEQECELHHDYMPSQSKTHPARPPHSNWHCPRCRVFD